MLNDHGVCGGEVVEEEEGWGVGGEVGEEGVGSEEELIAG